MSADAWIGLAGVFLGAALSQGGVWLQRRWDRADRQRADMVRYAEEFSSYLEELNDWQISRFKLVLKGEVTDLVPPRIVRLQLLLSAYFSDMEPAMREVAQKIKQLQTHFFDLAVAMQGAPSTPPPQTVVDSVRDAMAELMSAIGAVTEDIAKLLRKQHHGKD